jgi:excisionase family DNA binding protein
MDDILTLQQLAHYLHVGEGKLYKLAQQGKIPAAKVGRTWRFRKDLIDSWFTRGGLATTQDHSEPDIRNK